MATAAQQFLLRSESVCSLHATGCHYRFPLEPGHANMCGVKRTHKKPLHISSGDPQGEITVSTRNTSSAKSAWTFVVQLPGFHHCMQLKKNYILTFALKNSFFPPMMLNLLFLFNSSQSFECIKGSALGSSRRSSRLRSHMFHSFVSAYAN